MPSDATPTPVDPREDDPAVIAVGPMGSRTWAVALKLGVSTSAARRRLARLEARGVVTRHPRYSAVNDIYWLRAETEGQ